MKKIGARDAVGEGRAKSGPGLQWGWRWLRHHVLAASRGFGYLPVMAGVLPTRIDISWG